MRCEAIDGGLVRQAEEGPPDRLAALSDRIHLRLASASARRSGTCWPDDALLSRSVRADFRRIGRIHPPSDRLILVASGVEDFGSETTFHESERGNRSIARLAWPDSRDIAKAP